MNIPEKLYWTLADYMEMNGGLTSTEIIESFGCENFKFKSEADFTNLMYIIEKAPNTYWGIGPFIQKKGKWYNIRSKKKKQIEKLTDANKELKNKFEELELELYRYKKNKV